MIAPHLVYINKKTTTRESHGVVSTKKFRLKTICLSSTPTRLADGLGLKSSPLKLDVLIEIHSPPGDWFPRFQLEIRRF